MNSPFSAKLDQHGAWRRQFGLRVKLLAQWLQDHDLHDDAVNERLSRLTEHVREDKIRIAFVAEVSRGKSELINAVFFSDYGQRIMPASAGRTTMCPTELGYDPVLPVDLRLLPIETRLRPQSLMEWRMVPEKWERVPLDVDNPEQLAAALAKVTETRSVTPEEAQALGLWQQDTPPTQDTPGRVEIPRWRHALINFAHPLLKQGLVILDTPGLNAIGAEPELTFGLIPMAHAVVFLLAADAGVTKSDLAIWQDYLSEDPDSRGGRLVVLNKIDTLWDALSTPEQIQRQIDKQRRLTASTLGVDIEQILPVSAQKGLVAKVKHDSALLQRSQLPALEAVLGEGILSQRQRMLGTALARTVTELRVEVGRVIAMRRRDCTEQEIELKGLQGKNTPVIRSMRVRITQEQAEFDAGGARIQAVRAVHVKLIREIYQALSSSGLKQHMNALSTMLQQKGIKLGAKRAYEETFSQLRNNFEQIQAKAVEVQEMLAATFRQLNTEHGFTLQPPMAPKVEHYLHDLDLVQRSHLKYLGLGNALRLAQPEFASRLVRTLLTRLRSIHEAAASDIELWSKSSTAQLDAQLRERRRNFARRLEAIDRIQQASGGLDERIAELRERLKALDEQEVKLQRLCEQLSVEDAADSEPVRAAA